MGGQWLGSRQRSFSERCLVTLGAAALASAMVSPLAMESRSIDVRLAAYVLGVGGREDGAGVNILHKLAGKYDVPEYHPVPYLGQVWPVSGLTSATLDKSVEDGYMNLSHELARLPQGELITIVGYSLGAVAVNQVRRDLRSKHPAGDPNIKFTLLGDANTPNGGIFARFPWLHVPIIDITSTGSIEPDQFKETLINIEYDPYGDFPAYFNPFSLVNALAGVKYAHEDPYYDAINLDDPNLIKSTNGNTTYYLAPAKHLPLLQPLRDIAAQIHLPVGPFLDAIEPALRVLIDAGYDRETSPGTTKGFHLLTPIKNIADALKKLPDAIQEGIENFHKDIQDAEQRRDQDAKPTDKQQDSARLKNVEKGPAGPPARDQSDTSTQTTQDSNQSKDQTARIESTRTDRHADSAARNGSARSAKLEPESIAASTTTTGNTQDTRDAERARREDAKSTDKQQDSTRPKNVDSGPVKALVRNQSDTSAQTTQDSSHTQDSNQGGDQTKLEPAKPEAVKPPDASYSTKAVRDSLKSVPGATITGGGTKTPAGFKSAGSDASTDTKIRDGLISTPRSKPEKPAEIPLPNKSATSEGKSNTVAGKLHVGAAD